MKVIKNFHKTNVQAPHLNNDSYLKNRIGFWALVKEVNSLNNTVTVVSDTGFEYSNIPVKSDEWVTLKDNYIPSQRNLPPKNSRVFVLTPTFTAVGAFVLCSGFSRGDENIRTLWAANDNELEDKNNSRETKTQGGWDITEEYANGNYKAVSNDENIEFQANPVQDDNKSQNKGISLNAWGNSIVINEDGITVTDKNNNTVEATSDGIIIQDKVDNKYNTIQMADSGITITDVHGNKIELKVIGTSPNQKNNITIANGSNKSSIIMEDSKVTISNGPNNSTFVMDGTVVTINNHLEVSK